MSDQFNSYGIKHFNVPKDDVDRHIEELRIVGYTAVKGPWTPDQLKDFSARLDLAQERQTKETGGKEFLKTIGEANTVRLPLAEDPIFLGIATCPTVLDIANRMMDDYIILNQQNGILNPGQEPHHQTAYHRDLPFQHFTSSAPIAINALMCVDEFREDNGATWVIPGSHHWDLCPSLETIKKLSIQVTAPPGTYLVLDSMIFHAAGHNKSPHPRRAVNNVYTRAFVRQQINIPRALNNRYSEDPKLARLLGYQDQCPESALAWRQNRAKQKSQK